MASNADRPLSSEPSSAPGADRSEQLLRGMYRVFSHDLPNQMVALQSLLQLLNLEEATRLSDDGREYVRRLQNAARRAADMVQFLKDMSRLNRFVAQIEPIALPALSRELQGELQRRFPEREFAFDWQLQTPSLVSDSRALLEAILELCSETIGGANGRWRWKGTSLEAAGQVVMSFELRTDSAAPAPASNAKLASQDEPMDVTLARAWLSMGNATLEVTAHTADLIAFSISVPARLAHD